MRNFGRVIAVLVVVVLFGPASRPADAGHDVFHIFTPAVEAGHFGFEVLSTFQDPPRAHDHDDEDEGEDDDHAGHGHTMPRTAHEIAVHVGVTDFWMTKLALGISREDGDSYGVDTIASENVFRFGPARGGALDLGWFTALSAGLDSEATNAIELGPIVTLVSGPMALTVNPFFEKTFGRNREEGIAFTYGWRATYAVHDTFAIGVEGYGEIENIGNAPPGAEQVHRIGPVLYFGHMHGSTHGGHNGHGAHGGHGHGAGHHGGHAHGGEEVHTSHARDKADWHAEVGVLFGLTEATPDAALKVNLGVDF